MLGLLREPPTTIDPTTAMLNGLDETSLIGVIFGI